MHRSPRDRLLNASSLGALRAILSSAIAITLPACHDAATAPKAAAPAVSHSVAIAADHGGMSEALADASTRLAPSISDVVARAELNGLLHELSAQLDAGDVDKARTTLARARKALDSNRTLKLGEQADLAVIGLALDQVENLLNTTIAP
jgi:DNA-directed RNA polymerase specialized sigma24 family protein